MLESHLSAHQLPSSECSVQPVAKHIPFSIRISRFSSKQPRKHMYKSVLFSFRRRLYYNNSKPLHIAMKSGRIRHGAADTCATICSSALLSTELSFVSKLLFRKALNIYSILSTSLYNSTLLLWWSFIVQI